MMKTISVTQADIDAGKAGDCGLCPIALAAKRAFPDKFPAVSAYNLYLDSEPGKDDGEAIPLPVRATEFVVDFDRGHPVGPVEFTVRIDG